MHLITRSCVLFLWMHTLTSVKSQDCTRESFLNGPLYDSNFDTSDLEASYPGGKQVRVSCSVGHSGFFRLICVEGKWQSRGSKCQPRSCGHPGDAQFADFQLEKGEDFVFGSKVVYTCHKGYQMVSRTNYRRCMAEGWDGVVPVCEAQQCPVIHVDNNVQVNGDPEEATYGNVVRFSCKSNTEILSGPTEIYCDENGDWSAEPPKCKAIQCEAPTIENGDVHGNIKVYKEHDVLHFKCDLKYKPAENRPSKCTKLGTRAEWSPTPVCEPVKCRLEPTTLGAWYDPPHRNVFSPGDTVRVFCGERYWISNHRVTSAVATCNDDGEWDERPICQEVICSNPRDNLVSYWDDYWRQQPKLDETIRYTCRRGYKSTDGATHATCTREGWRPNPLCQEITCDRQDIPNANTVYANKQIYKINEVAKYVCREGYQGSPTRTCRENGWAGYSQCTEITCNRQDIPNANTEDKKQIYKYNDKVDYVCKNGYRGNVTLTCGGNGWIGSLQCTEITCDRKRYLFADIERNIKPKYRYNDQVEYICKNGHMGRFTLTCLENGWIGSPQCAKCEKADVQNGFVLGPYNDTVYYSCNEGYKLFTKGWWGEATCIDGVWSGLQQCIDEKNCGEIPLIPNSKMTPQHNDYEDGKRIEIICKEGYQAQDGLTCHNGTWRSIEPLETICTPIANHCNPPPKVENAVVETSYQKNFLPDSEVTYKCHEKYTMEGEDTIRCIDGNWEKKNIYCTPPLGCERPPLLANGHTKERPQVQYSHNEKVEYTCHNDYIMEGEPYKTCINSEWIGDMRCLKPCNVDENVMTMNYIVFKNRSAQLLTHNEEIEFKCTKKKKHDRAVMMRQRCVDGVLTLPTCQ